MKKWEDISTAPCDGSLFQAWVVADNGIGFWEPKCRIRDGQFLVFAFVDRYIYGFDPIADDLTPTHWKPHPVSPDTEFFLDSVTYELNRAIK